jgi:hypothetical protein
MRPPSKLPKEKWFHYSGDYRIGTKYLDEPILDNIKQQAMEVPFLKELLLSDSIYIRNNVTVENLAPISSFLSKLGNSDFLRTHFHAGVYPNLKFPSFYSKKH